MSKSVGVKVERWFEQISSKSRFIGALYVEHRRVSELHPTKGWRGVLDQSGDRQALRNPDRAWGRLIAQGASIVQTDHPAVLLDYLERRGLRGHAPVSIAAAGLPPSS